MNNEIKNLLNSQGMGAFIGYNKPLNTALIINDIGSNKSGQFMFVTNDDVSNNIHMSIKSTGNVGINTTNPSQKLDVNGNIKGIYGMFIDISSNTLKANDLSSNNIVATDLSSSKITTGNFLYKSTVGEPWEDLRVLIGNLSVSGLRRPTNTMLINNGIGSTGVYSYYFSSTLENEIYFDVQLPHGWRQGTNIKPHAHWCPTTANAGSVVWGLEYTIANISSTFGNTTIIYGTGTTESIAFKHYSTNLTDIDMSGNDVSTILICRAFRAATALGDTYPDSVALLSFDFHYELALPPFMWPK